ncbi:MAG: NAD(P)/FAD-dependent oxidoreductase [Pseudomonadota bacterium]
MAGQVYLIVGAGHAGGRAAETIRQAGFAGTLVLVGEERYRPYERPPLSKELLLAPAAAHLPFLREGGYYAAERIDFRPGIRVMALDRAARQVLLSTGDRLAYDRLLLATGGRARTLAVPGADLSGVLTLRDLDDCQAIAAGLRQGASVVVIGAGFIGLEVAAAARTRGARVSVLEATERLMGRAVPPDIGDIFARLHRARGVELRLGIGVIGFEGRAKVERVVLGDGTALAADLVVVGIGIKPNDELAADSGLAVADGILVDEFGATSDPRIAAAGDATRHYNPSLGRHLRLESWHNAQNQAIAVARTMCGAPTPYAQVPWFWTDQYDVNLQMVGAPESIDGLVFRGDPAGPRFTAFALAGGAVVAAYTLNAARDMRLARKLVEANMRVDPGSLGDEKLPLKDVVARG